MNASLVAFYGATPKPSNLAKLVSDIHKILEKHPELEFTPYEDAQVHATLVGLEGLRVGDQIVSANFAKERGMVKRLRIRELADHLLSSKHLPITVRIGGFSGALSCPFASRGVDPSIRSFKIQGHVAVAMGWPTRDGHFPPTLDLLRRDLATFGALHKYHTSDGDVDNDFFFVLGQVERRGINDVIRQTVEEEVREYLSEREPTDVECDLDALSFVAYPETTLMPKRTKQFSVLDIAGGADTTLIKLYDAAR